MMFFSMSTTLNPLRRNSAAALMPLKPPPTISTSHLMSFVRGGQYLCSLTIRVVIHQFWLTSLTFVLIGSLPALPPAPWSRACAFVVRRAH